eukprot:10435259-Alexandrium_andersonii.AAC.1
MVKCQPDIVLAQSQTCNMKVARGRQHIWITVHSAATCSRCSKLRTRQPVSYTHLTLPTICSV